MSGMLEAAIKTLLGRILYGPDTRSLKEQLKTTTAASAISEVITADPISRIVTTVVLNRELAKKED